ncbi:MAG: pentapeptide repeat-containing protein, partial [Gammaproteobacteria bacterium]|nr:pentapeptide repeat-containing protein [Gammaproteobacteria bacterium]
MNKHQPLYIRKDDKILGPFPQKQISEFLLLGRFKLADEVSTDRENWVVIKKRLDLVPDVLKIDPEDENAQERLKAARRWADERRPEHGQVDQSRRITESDEVTEYRDHRESVYKRFMNTREFSLIQSGVVLAIFAGLIYAGFQFAPKIESDDPVCDQPAAIGINWRNCLMTGIQSLRSELRNAALDSAILTNANLFASDLSNASLMYTNLSLANLSFVNFTGANLKGSNMQQADLSQANFSGA